MPYGLDMRVTDMDVTDPRNPANTLTVRYRLDRAAVEPHGHGEHFDPGSGPEISLRDIWNASGSVARIKHHRHLEAIMAEVERRACP